MSFFTADHEWWDVHVRSIPKPWPAESVLLDLRAHQSLAVAPKPTPFPSRRVLAARWGWSEGMTRAMLANEARWSDPFIVGDRERSARWSAAVGERSTRNHREPDNNPTSTRQLPDNSPTTNGNPSFSDRVEPDNNPTSTRQLPDEDHTRVGSQSTEHRAQTTEDMETRAPEPPAAPAKPKRTKPSPDQPSDSERPDWDDLLGAYAEIDPDGARRIDSGRSTGLAREALALLRAGPDVAVRRLRYLARGPGRDADFARRPDGPRGSALLRRSSAWCATVDDAAAAWADRASMLAAQPTDSRWRDPGWSPTRTAARQQAPPGKPPESITERALTVHELARQLQENRHAARDHRHDDRDLLALEGGGPQAPGGVARRTG